MEANRRSKISIISMILTMGAFILFLIATVINHSYSQIIMFGGLALLLASWAIFFFGYKQPQIPIERVLTIIGCKNCDYKEERQFMEGDYIFKELGPCKKCSGLSYIMGIYSVTIKKE
ncbi:MAG: hypothetical protein NZ922_00100 [Candidatus Methanomethyliaceae archaeon]|nr:hypothetical protein [Candidatus Methanomethyliaceae archaeon]MDW7971171.1 hypothetical protein [Nitrososphaerota archaeon]